ncbi:MAG: superoxide dismutase [Marmoricola sp.]
MSILGRSTRSLLTVLLVAGLTAAAPPGASATRTPGPQRINLPDGFQPEGIAIGRRPVAYLGSLAGGDIYRADLRTGRGRVISQGVDGTQAVGMKLGPKGRLWVAGGAGGAAKVVSTRTGRVLATYDFIGTTTGPTFINDVVLRKRAAWFTNSRQAVLHKVSPVKGRPAQARVQTVPLTGAWNQVENEFNANGISTTPDGRALLVVQSVTGKLFRVNPSTGRAVQVGLRGYLLTNGDGMLRKGRTLYVAQNRDNKVAVLRLTKRGYFGRLVGTLRSPGFDVPTTIARHRSSLYLPNARFGTATPTPETADYWITRVRLAR